MLNLFLQKGVPRFSQDKTLGLSASPRASPTYAYSPLMSVWGSGHMCLPSWIPSIHVTWHPRHLGSQPCHTASCEHRRRVGAPNTSSPTSFLISVSQDFASSCANREGCGGWCCSSWHLRVRAASRHDRRWPYTHAKPRAVPPRCAAIPRMSRSSPRQIPA